MGKNMTVSGQPVGRISGWVEFVGVGNVRFHGRGVSSVTYNSVGNYTVNFATENQVDQAQSVFLTEGRPGGGATNVEQVSQTDTTLRVQCKDGGGVNAERSFGLWSFEIPPDAE